MRRANALIVTLALMAAAGCRPTMAASPPANVPEALRSADTRRAMEFAALERKHLAWPEDARRFEEAARTAWVYVQRRGQTATGLITPIGSYPYVTIWDVGSTLAALYSARQLGLLADAPYHARMQRILATLRRAPLYDNAVFGRSYDSRSMTMVRSAPGWSTTDLGRLFIWLRIVAADPRFAEAAERVVRRNDFTRLVRDGYLWGETIDAQGRRHQYQEARIGYEQYAAAGFALWGVRAERALRLRENALPASVMRQPLLADRRRSDRLMNEPFLLLGLETGWDRETRQLVAALLRAQEARYKKTGVITITGEDAIDQPPHFFYYYCVLADGKAFAVDVQDPDATVDGPRWVSAKSAFAFHALMPTGYTEAAVDVVAPARRHDGWASGVFERTGVSTGAQSVNLNTAAVILTAALVNKTGQTILAEARRPQTN